WGALAAAYVVAAIVGGAAARQFSQSPSEEFMIGILLGINSGQASAAVVPMTIGPGRFITRVSISLFMLALASLPFLVYAVVEQDLEILFSVDGAMLAQFALVQIPLWIARV